MGKTEGNASEIELQLLDLRRRCDAFQRHNTNAQDVFCTMNKRLEMLETELARYQYTRKLLLGEIREVREEIRGHSQERVGADRSLYTMDQKLRNTLQDVHERLKKLEEQACLSSIPDDAIVKPGPRKNEWELPSLPDDKRTCENCDRKILRETDRVPFSAEEFLDGRWCECDEEEPRPVYGKGPLEDLADKIGKVSGKMFFTDRKRINQTGAPLNESEKRAYALGYLRGLGSEDV